MIEKTKLEDFQKRAKNVRRNIVEMVYSAKSGHPGGSLSITDILVALYFSELRINVKNPKDENRDRVVLSKGHCSPALYSVLAEKGYFEKDELKKSRIDYKEQDIVEPDLSSKIEEKGIVPI